MAYTYEWANEQKAVLFRTDSDGLVVSINPDPSLDLYQEYLRSGVEASPYVAPPEPPPLTTEQKVNRLLSDYGLTREEMRAALNAKSS